MLNPISSYLCIRNAIEGDYCIRECITSLLPISTEVVVLDASDDGTFEMLTEWAATESKLRILHHPWTQPVGDVRWYVNWLNAARGQLRYPYQLTLDADEVLDESAYPLIESAAQEGYALWFERLNFERNCHTIIPHGYTCGNRVVRCGPTHYWMPSDEPYASAADEPEIRKIAICLAKPPIIHHYGFLRCNSAMFVKSRVNLTAFFNHLDDRLVRAEAEGQHWLHYVEPRSEPYITYDGAPPPHCIPWLTERGAL